MAILRDAMSKGKHLYCCFRYGMDFDERPSDAPLVTVRQALPV
jgi:hypothetical protein